MEDRVGLEERINQLKGAASAEEARAASQEAKLKAICRRELEAAGREAAEFLRAHVAPTHTIGVEKRRVIGGGYAFVAEGSAWVLSSQHDIALTDRGELVCARPVEGRRPRLVRVGRPLEDFLRYTAQLEELSYCFPPKETYFGSDLHFTVDRHGTRVEDVPLAEWLARVLAAR